MNLVYDKELDFNFITSENNAKVVSFSSQNKGCPSTNIISSDRKAIWLSEESTPQNIVIDFSSLKKKPKSHFRYFGVYCWHAYSTNPKCIELQFSKDNKNFVSFGKFELALKPGTQFMEIKNIKSSEFQKFRYLKIIVKETHGGNRTYLNQIYLFEELSGQAANTGSTMNSNKVTQISDIRNPGKKVRSDSQSLFIEDDKREQEEEIEKAPTEMEKSKLLKNLIEDNYDDEESYSDKKFIDLDDGDYNQNSRIKNKKLKKIENILKNKIKNNVNKKNKFTASDYSNEEIDYNNINDKIETDLDDLIANENLEIKIKKNTNKSNKTNTSEIGERSVEADYKNLKKNNPTNLNKNFNVNVEKNEYEQLECQLKEMEDHLKSMGAEYKLENYKSYGSGIGSISHSKSFSFLHPIKDTITNRTSNPFINNKERDHIYQDPSPLYKANSKSEKNILNNYIFENESKSESNYAQKNFNNNGIFTENQENASQLEVKIQNIENKIDKFENDLSEMKVTFQKLLDNMNKLIEDGVFYNNNNFNPNFASNKDYRVENDELVNIILNECSKMINEKFNTLTLQNSSGYYNHNPRRDSAVKSRTNDHCKNYDNEVMENDENEFFINQKINKKIENKFESLATNIESQIYNNFLKPTVSTIERTMRANFEDIKSKIKTIERNELTYTGIYANANESCTYSLDSFNDYEYNKKYVPAKEDSPININRKNKNKLRETEREKVLDTKLDQINTLGGRLYEKLVEKEKKLNELKSETANYLKKKAQNRNTMLSSVESNLFNSEKKK